MFEIGQNITHYEVTGVLGRWLGGQQYRAVQRKTGLEMMLSTLGPALLPTPTLRREFVTKQSRSYGVRHPHAQPLVDLFAHGDEVVVVTSFQGAPTLYSYVEQKKRVPRAEAFGIVEQLISAVAQYHQNDIVLGDIFPDAVWVTPQGALLTTVGTGLLLPRDRFLAAARAARRWRWLAPELKLGRQGDRASDVYQLACLAHYVLYGVAHPFSDGVRRGLFAGAGRWLCFGGRPRPGKRRWPYVDEVLRRALSGYQADRPRDVEGFVVELRRALVATPVDDGDFATSQAPPPAPAPPPAANYQAAAPPPAGPAPALVSSYVPPSVAGTMMMEPPSSLPPVISSQVPEQPRTMMAPAPEQPRTMMAPMPEPQRVISAGPPPSASEQPRTMIASAPVIPPPAPPAPSPSPLSASEPQRTMAMSAPTPEMLAGLGLAPPAPRPPSPRPSSPQMPAAPRPAPEPQRTVAMSAPPPDKLAGLAPRAPAPMQAPTPSAPAGANSTQPVDIGKLSELLKASEKPSTQSPNEHRTAQIDSAEIERLLAKTRDPNDK